MPQQPGILILIWLSWFATYIPSGWVDVRGTLFKLNFSQFLFVFGNYFKLFPILCAKKIKPLQKNYSTHFNLVFYQMGSVCEVATLVWLVACSPKYNSVYRLVKW
jgi:hypothetical protein